MKTITLLVMKTITLLVMKTITLLVLTLCPLVILCQSSVTVGLNSTPQTVDLGYSGYQTIQSITLVCETSASTYNWEVDAPWQTTTGQTNSFSTSSNTITLVPISGYLGCAGGTVGVTGGGGGQQLRPMEGGSSTAAATASSSFSYIVGFNVTAPYLGFSLVQQGDFTQVTVTPKLPPGSTWTTFTLSNVTPTSSSITFQTNSANNPAVLGALAGPAPATYTAVVSTTITIPPSQYGTCGTGTRTLSQNLVIHEDSDPGGSEFDGCYNFDLEKVDCYTGKIPADGGESAVKIFPNPVTDNVIVELKNGKSSGILFDQSGFLVESRENIEGSISWDMSNLRPGFYFLKITNGNSSTVKRLVVNRK